MNKICIYAICKNEIDHIDAWLDSMSEADYICVLDTGSTDGSYEKLKSDQRVTCVKKAEIKPWRFDIARNESMKLAPDDANILMCTDFDEWLEPGWAQVLRDNWTDEITRCHYTYAWSHNDLGEPQDIFMYDKIHTRDYHWVFPVHEVLLPINDNFVEEVLETGDLIYLHHFQDKSKSRKNYYELLELSVKENPTDSHCKMLLARECIIKEDYEMALKLYLECLDMEDIYTEEKKLVLLETLGRIGDLYCDSGNISDAVKYYTKFLEYDTEHREPYFCLAEIYNKIGMYKMAVACIEEALNKTKQKYDWVERKDNWLNKSDEILSISYYYLGDYEKAVSHGKIAYEHNPSDERIMKNYIAYLEAKMKKDERMDI